MLAGDAGYFSLDEFSGVLRLEQPLTSDTPPTFELKIKATDRGLPRHLYSVATVTVDVVSLDDYQPVFVSSEYTAQVRESLVVGSEVLSVSALTRDGGGPDPIVYRIISGNEDGRFQLNSETGQNRFHPPPKHIYSLILVSEILSSLWGLLFIVYWKFKKNSN